MVNSGFNRQFQVGRSTHTHPILIPGYHHHSTEEKRKVAAVMLPVPILLVLLLACLYRFIHNNIELSLACVLTEGVT